LGIDPGIKVGYALIDLDGKLIGSGSTKGKNFDKVISIVSKFGIIGLVACDVNPPSKFSRKIAARFGVKCFFPRKSISKETKRMIGPGFKNAHEQDAYSAAIKAYRHYSNRFRRIDKIYPDKKEEYKYFILRGISIGKIKEKN
jgi:hypothetical protein